MPSTVAMSSPVDWKVALAPVSFWNASRTFWKLACSVPDHTAATVNDCPFRSGVEPLDPLAVVLDALLLSSSSPPHAAKANRHANNIASNRIGVEIFDTTSSLVDGHVGTPLVSRGPIAR